MKHWLNRHYKTIIVSAFVIPIIIVALVSISHVTIWYGISNPVSWAIYLSVGIEIAALSALAAISANMGKYVYFPFIVVTLLQFMGIDPTDVMGHKRFLALFSGGMLPVISLSFLHMLIKFTEADRLKDLSNDEKESSPIVEQPIVNEKETTQIDEKEFIENVSKFNPTEEDLKKLEKLLYTDRSNKEEVSTKEEEENLTEEEERLIVEDEGTPVGDFYPQYEEVVEDNVESFVTNPYQGEIPIKPEVLLNENIVSESIDFSEPIFEIKETPVQYELVELEPPLYEVKEVQNDVPQIDDVEQKKNNPTGV